MPRSISNRDWWKSFIELNSLQGVEDKRRTFSFLTMSAVASVVLSILLIKNSDIYAPLLSSTLLIALLAVVFNVVVYFSTRRTYLCSVLISLAILPVCLSLVYTGGKDNTALYWIMFYPIVVYTMLGAVFGSVFNSIILVGAALLLFGPEIGQANYGETEKTRFMAGFCLIILFSVISEFFREQSSKAIENITFNQKQTANSDGLTGLPNRRFIDSILVDKIKQDPNQFVPMVIMLGDIDKFKRINDTYGHDVGDTALIHLANLLKDNVRFSDVVARFGGEEFIICLPGTPLAQGEIIAEKLRALVEATPVESGELTIPMTISFGVAQLLHHSEFNKVVKRADTALYQAKEAGRNRVISQS